MRIIRAIIRFVRDVIRWTVYIIKEIVVDIIWITIMLPWLILKTILSLPRLMKRLVLALRQTAISSFSALEHLTRAAHRVPMAPEGLHISLGTASLATRTFLANFMTIVAHTIALPRYTVLLLWRVWTGGESGGPRPLSAAAALSAGGDPCHLSGDPCQFPTHARPPRSFQSSSLSPLA